MKKNGFTLIELLVSLALLGMVLGLLFSVFSSGIKQGDNTKKKVYLQQEANSVATFIRNKYLNNGSFTLMVSNNQIVVDGSTISSKYQYTVSVNGIDQTGQTISIQNNSSINLVVTFTGNSYTYTLRTTLSRGV